MCWRRSRLKPEALTRQHQIPHTKQAYRQCLQGWAPTLLQQLSAPAAPVPIFPCFLEWAEAALLPLLNHTTISSSSDTSALVPAAWDIYATVARRCGEALLALTGAAGNGTARGGASEARGTYVLCVDKTSAEHSLLAGRPID